nr:hypothetical protein [Cellulosimicrobium sp. MM]
MRVSVSGGGRRGVLHAACLAAAGHEVVLLDPDPRVLAALRSGPRTLSRGCPGSSRSAS